MRALLTFFFTVLGVFLTYLFLVSTAGSAPQDAPLAVRLAAPFKELESTSVLCLQSALACYLIASYFKLCASSENIRSRDIRNRVLETGFLVNVLLVAVILTAFVAYGSGWFVNDSLTSVTLGALLGVATLEVAVGIVLAIILARRTRSRGFYYSVLSAHVAETSLLAFLFFVGATS